MIKGSDVSLPLGLYTFKDTEKSVVVDGNITTIKALKELKIPAVPSSASGQGSPNAGASAQATQMNPATMNGIPTVTLDEIADIKEVGKAESISRTNGKEAIGIQIVKVADANTVDVVNAVKDKVNDLEKIYKT